MKTIYLIRHAKSSWKNLNITDFERSLNNRGLNDALIIAEELKKLNFNPCLIICSPAKRTRKTLKIFNKHLNLNENRINFVDSIYESSTENLIQLINNLPTASNSVALIGHNPSITQLFNYLTDNFIDNIPTCGVVKIELEISNWNEIIKGIGLQKFFIYPKMF